MHSETVLHQNIIGWVPKSGHATTCQPHPPPRVRRHSVTSPLGSYTSGCCLFRLKPEMSRSGDLARVVKGAGKVAKAFLDAEAPAVAQRLLRLREHGQGLTCSLKDAMSSALSSTVEQGSPPSEASSKPSSGVVDAPKLVSSSNAHGLAVGPPGVNGPELSLKKRPSAQPAPATEERIRYSRASGEAQSRIETQTKVPAAGEPGRSSIHDTTAETSSGENASPIAGAGAKIVEESGTWAFADHAATDTSVAGAKTGDGNPDGVSGIPRRGGMHNSRARTVPSSPLARVFGFGQLAAGLAIGTVAEAVRQSVAGGEADRSGENAGRRQRGAVKNYVVTDANAERLAETLCRMRGAALKLGQMLSIQDESVIPPSLAKALDRVRQGADIMPLNQLHQQLEKSFGADWRSKLSSFDETPIAAASIGQVHRARLLDGTEVAMKIQYPGVANSVESDLNNLQLLVKLTNILPPGLYIDEIIKVGREELSEECDYEKEAAHQERFRTLVESDEHLRKWASVPRVVPELLSKEVLTTHLSPGVPVDQILDMPQEVRNHVSRMMLRCTVNELFEWRFMQTDPNWGNFLFDRATGKMSLIDFGACREYKKEFVDGYFQLVWAAANRDEDTILKVSKELKFLTGDETQSMMEAHVKAGLVVGEPFLESEGEPFDFHGSNITARLSQHGDTFMKHRLTPPPREAYSLHRKLAGAFLMNIKLKAVIPCRDILQDVHDRYSFG